MMSLRTFLQLVAISSALAAMHAGEPYRTTRERTVKKTSLSLDDHARLRRVRSIMDTVVFPKVSLLGVSFREAVHWVTIETPRHVPGAVPSDQRGFSTVVRFRESAAEMVNISLQSATLPQVLDAICSQHDYVWCLESRAISIVPREKASH